MMRIAQIAPASLPVPPRGYGSIEIVAALLADGLTDRGDDVTLFASGGSKTRADLATFLDEAPGTGNVDVATQSHTECQASDVTSASRHVVATACSLTPGNQMATVPSALAPGKQERPGAKAEPPAGPSDTGSGWGQVARRRS
jgi:hypothetical protein